MAGCCLDVPGILLKLQSVGFCSDLSSSKEGISYDDLSSLFHRILSVFLSEIQTKVAIRIRPLPPMVGDGRAVDLLQLYWVVCEMGGYGSVTASRSWALVAERTGFDLGVGTCLKLVYFKYLGDFERLLVRLLLKTAVGHRNDRFEVKDNGFFHENSKQNKKRKDGDTVSPLSCKKVQFLTPVKSKERASWAGNGMRDDDDDDDDVQIIEPVLANGEMSLLKRKREALVGMMNWVRRLAKNPHDPSAQKLLSNGTKSSAHLTGELFSQALKARSAIYLKKFRRDKPDDSSVWKEQKSFSSRYGDCIHNNALASQTVRRSPGLRCINSYHAGSSSKSSSILGVDGDNGLIFPGDESIQRKQRHRNSSTYHDDLAGLLYRDPQQRRIPVGPSFQAKIPDWTGRPSAISSDSDELKWLGTRIWPRENQENGSSSAQNSIGKGRQETCHCEQPGSVACVRFHIAEKRFELKRELGPVFLHWRFDSMGEEVALSWTDDEERRFKTIVRLNPSSGEERFWNQLYLGFPFKRRRKLVSYYFNVFLLRRRSYQNRLMPRNIDSDDEDIEIGFLSSSYGHDTIKTSDSKLLICTQNTQCVELD